MGKMIKVRIENKELKKFAVEVIKVAENETGERIEKAVDFLIECFAQDLIDNNTDDLWEKACEICEDYGNPENVYNDLENEIREDCTAELSEYDNNDNYYFDPDFCNTIDKLLRPRYFASLEIEEL